MYCLAKFQYYVSLLSFDIVYKSWHSINKARMKKEGEVNVKYFTLVLMIAIIFGSLNK
mgnify:CR=1 FL=1